MPEEAVALPPAEKPTTAAPQSTQGAPPPQSIDDVYGEFDNTETASPPKKEAAPARPPSKPAAKPAPKPATGAEEKPDHGTPTTEEAESKETSAKPAGTKESEPKLVLAKDLRNAYETQKRELGNLRAELERVKKSSSNEGEVKQLRELLDSERKARTDLENELKHTAYERSEEYKSKFQKPYLDAYQMGRNKTASLKVQPKIDDLGEEIAPARQGTQEDFDTIMKIADDDTAAEKAIELFGPKAQMVLYYRERANELYNSAKGALEEHRTNASQREKEQAEARSREQEQQTIANRARAESFERFKKAGREARAELYDVPEGDTEAQEVVKRGEEVADSLFTGINPKTKQPYTPEGLIKFHAFVHNAVAAHGNMLRQLRSAKDRIAELESDLEEVRKSGSSPDSGRGGDEGRKSSLAGDEEFDEAERTSSRKW